MLDPAGDFLPVEMSAMVEAELSKGERIEWIGQPIAGRVAIASVPMAVLGLFFGGFAVFWMASARGIAGRGPGLGGFSALFWLWGLPFLAIGLAMFLSPIWAYRKASRTLYAITDRRAIAIEPSLMGRVVVRSFEPPDLAILARTQNPDGSGNLVFRREAQYAGRRQGTRYVDVGFLAVSDAKDVEDRIRALIQRTASVDRGR